MGSKNRCFGQMPCSVEASLAEGGGGNMSWLARVGVGFGVVMFSVANASAENYYVSPSGNDSNTGVSEGQAWQSISKVNGKNFQPGDQVLLKYGGRWGDTVDLSKENGGAGSPIVLSAYGDPSQGLPVVKGVTANYASYVTISNVEVDGQGAGRIDASYGANNIFIYKVVVHNTSDNAVRFFGPSYSNIVMSSLIYDVGGTNDAITIHAVNWGSSPTQAGYSYWIVDNDIIGSGNMEDLVDVGPDENQTTGNLVMDIKIYGNRLQCESVPGVSSATGTANFGLNSGHLGDGFWVVGNTVTGCKNAGLQIQNSAGEGRRKGVQLSGNVVFRAGTDPKNSVIVNAEDFVVSNNTVVRHEFGDRSALFVSGYGKRGQLVKNLFSIDSSLGTNTRWVSATDVVATAFSVIEGNHLADISGAPLTPQIDGVTVTSLRSIGMEQTGSSGAILPVKMPSGKTDPRSWGKDFLSYFVPNSAWSQCADDQTPGALDCKGRRLGLELKPLAVVSGDGFGWKGNEMVQAFVANLTSVNAPVVPSLPPAAFKVE
ncbi:MAG: hypothetical protein IPM37_03145 [Hahellaceae bacterium]|nr:hypothetical protein [Hahellaceae bacterium]